MSIYCIYYCILPYLSAIYCAYISIYLLRLSIHPSIHRPACHPDTSLFLTLISALSFRISSPTNNYITIVRMKPTLKQPRWCLHCRWYDFQSTLWEVLSMELRRCFHQWQPWDMGWSVFFLMNMWYYDMTKESCWYYDMSLDFMMRLIRREYEIMLKSLYRWYLRLRTTWYRCIDTKWYKHSKCWPLWKSFEPKSSESL